MSGTDVQVVTGPFGYSGRRITQRLLDRGINVRGLTNSQRPSSFTARIETSPLAFDNPARLAETLRGASVLYNTYWIRFNYGDFTRAEAIRNSLMLFDAAREAGVRRIVHVSIANPSEESPFEYYSGKARLERAIRESGLSYCILRPAVLFGDEDILINNIAWILRRFPVFGIFGDGAYGIRPIHIDDFADLAVQSGFETENTAIDAVGPERFTYRELVEAIRRILNLRRMIVRIPTELGYWIGRAIGRAVGDVVLTRDEIGALMSGLLDSHAPATGKTKLTEWARQNVDSLGKYYASELIRRSDRNQSYSDLRR
jgi:NADH dehydrogenase